MQRVDMAISGKELHRTPVEEGTIRPTVELAVLLVVDWSVVDVIVIDVLDQSVKLVGAGQPCLPRLWAVRLP